MRGGMVRAGVQTSTHSNLFYDSAYLRKKLETKNQRLAGRSARRRVK